MRELGPGGILLARRETPLDAACILRRLGRHRVEYMLIGGLAVQAHGHTRTTQDVDIVPDAEPGNLERLAAALRELGARPAGARGQEGQGRFGGSFSPDGVTSLDTDAGGLDVYLRPVGAAPYEQLRRRALIIEVAGVTVAVAGRDDLIAMKRASGRPIDRGDVIALTAPERG